MKISLELLLACLAFFVSFNVTAIEPDWTTYNQLLKDYVKVGVTDDIPLNTVNYSEMHRDKRFKQVVKQLEFYDVSQLDNKNERLSFYINAYNIFALKMVIDHWEVKSIKNIGSFFSPVWKKPVGKLNGKMVSLHHVEHEVLRKMDDPRIHLAIVCASVSCPDLRNEAYAARQLDQQLDNQSLLFLQNTKKGLFIKGNTAHVSKIFGWFKKDFKKQGGVKSYINHCVPLADNIEIDADINYNWLVNKN